MGRVGSSIEKSMINPSFLAYNLWSLSLGFVTCFAMCLFWFLEEAKGFKKPRQLMICFAILYSSVIKQRIGVGEETSPVLSLLAFSIEVVGASEVARNQQGGCCFLAHLWV
jgi:hypothetical protein